MDFHGPIHRFRIRCWRYLRIRDFLQVGMGLAGATLAVAAYSSHPSVTRIAGASYVIFLLIAGITTIRQRVARGYLMSEVLWGLFSHMNREIFRDDSRTRFTLFRRDPFFPQYIVPWYRFRKGATDGIYEADLSKARYRRGEGYTGKAWEDPGSKLYCAAFPDFKTRAEFETYYIDELQIDPKAVRDISDYMWHTRTLFSYGFTDSRGKFLGVLSLDIQHPISEGMGGESSENSQAPFLDAPAMFLIVRSIQNVLESFEGAHERKGYE